MQDTLSGSALAYKGLKRAGIDFAVSNPCGWNKKIMQSLEDDPEVIYVPVTREEEGVAIAAGAYMAGKKPVVVIQNSGFANSINTVTSLLCAYRIPLLFLVSYRGHMEEKFFPHFPLGIAMEGLLRSLGLLYYVLEEPAGAEELIFSAQKTSEAGRSPVVILTTPRGLR